MDLDTFQNVFHAEEYLYFYGDFLSDARLKKELDFLTQFAQLDRPLQILDLACGYGRHANALAARGHRVTGIDLSPEFLAVAKRANTSVTYLCQDMRDLSYSEEFDRIFALFTALGYFEEEENEEVFSRIYEALKPGGIFCFDSHNRDSFLTYAHPSSVIEKEGNFLMDQTTFNTLTGRSHTKRTVYYKGNLKTYDYSVRFYNPTELSTLLSRIGFSNIDFYDDWEGKPLHSKSKRMVVIAKK